MKQNAQGGRTVGCEANKRILLPRQVRRFHKKSRNGCLRCKQQHQKCTETKPRCTQCEMKGLECQYGERFVPVIKKANPQGEETVTKSLARPFCWQDMQALHHFLVFCPPVLPLGNREVWTRHIPQLAHEHPCVMQAILSLGASHLSKLKGHQQTGMLALQHRGNAMRSLQQLIAYRMSWSVKETDAAIAICYSLMFQASYLSDGISDYLTMVRGCALITEHIRKHNLPTSFDISLHRAHQRLAEKLDIVLDGCIYKDFVDDAVQAFDALQPYISAPSEMQFFSAICNIVNSFEGRARDGILTGIDMYGLWYHVAGPHLKAFTHPHNGMSKVILMYFLSIPVIFRILLPWQWWQESIMENPPKQAFWELLQWIDALEKTISLDLQERFDWPRKLVAQIPAAFYACADRGSATILLHPTLKVTYLHTMVQNAHIVLGDVLRVVAELCAWFETIIEQRFEARNKEVDDRSWKPNIDKAEGLSSH